MKFYFAKFFWLVLAVFTIASGSLGFMTAKMSVESVYASSFSQKIVTNPIDLTRPSSSQGSASQEITGNPTDLISSTGERFGQSDEPRDPRNIAFSIVRGLLAVIGMALLIMFLYAGYLWFSARGNDDQVTKAKTTLRNAVIGLLIVGFSYGIVTLIFETVFEPGFSNFEDYSELPPILHDNPSEGSRVDRN